MNYCQGTRKGIFPLVDPCGYPDMGPRLLLVRLLHRIHHKLPTNDQCGHDDAE